MTTTRPLPPEIELIPTCSPRIDDEAGFGALRTEKGHLPLEAMDVRGRIDGLLARVVVRQTFVNAFEEPLEAAYIFPLPDRAAVSHFRMMVAGREIEGVLEERGQAREHYDQAITQGRRASIAEEDRPGVFNLRVGNLMPGERATVELTLCGVLPYADGEVTFRFPLAVAPRYIPGKPLPGPSVGDGTAVDTDAVPDASRISPPVLLPGFPNPIRLSLEVELHDGAASADCVRSSLHAVQEDLRDGYRRIHIRPGERLDRDFILRFRLGGDDIRPTLSLHPDADDRQQGTFALTVVPPAEPAGSGSRPRDVVFVLDRSGSMQGWKIVAARRAVARMIDTLGEADRFGVLAFDSTVEAPDTLPEGLASGGDRNRFRAVEYLARVEARGGTEMVEPLDRAVKLLGSALSDDRDRILVLITDGQVGNEDQILSRLGRRLKRIRTFTIGIDSAVNEGFLRRLAERGGGSCELVESEDRLDEVMAAIHRKIGTPLLTELSLDPQELSIEPGEVVPSRLPDLFPGSPLLILGRYRGRPQGAIAIRATKADGTAYSEPIPVSVRENPAIAAAWARGQIRQLEDRYATGDGDRPALEKAIVGISLRFQVLCRFTAYVAIDHSAVVNEGGSVHQITQPVEMPHGWAAPELSPAAVGMPVLTFGEPSRLSAGVWVMRSQNRRPGPTPPAPIAASPPPRTAPCMPSGGDSLVLNEGGSVRGITQPVEMLHGQAAPEQSPAAMDMPARALGVLSRLFAGGKAMPRDVHRLRPTPPAPMAAGPPPRTSPGLPSLGDLDKGLDDAASYAMTPLPPSDQTLANRLRSNGPRPPREAAEIVAELASALQQIHDRGLAHRSITPEHVLIDGSGHPRITAVPGSIHHKGKPLEVPPRGVMCYTPPERLGMDEECIDPRGDIYALGVILYELLTGCRPFRNEPGSQALVDEILRGAPTPPRRINRSIRRKLEAICLKAMARKPSARYATARQLAEALREFLAPRRGVFWK
jgi:Ca-activated chloride channel homolog